MGRIPLHCPLKNLYWLKSFRTSKKGRLVTSNTDWENEVCKTPCWRLFSLRAGSRLLVFPYEPSFRHSPPPPSHHRQLLMENVIETLVCENTWLVNSRNISSVKSSMWRQVLMHIRPFLSIETWTSLRSTFTAMANSEDELRFYLNFVWAIYWYYSKWQNKHSFLQIMQISSLWYWNCGNQTTRSSILTAKFLP